MVKGLKTYPRKLHTDGREYGKYKLKPNSQITNEDLEDSLSGKRLRSGHIPKFVRPLRDKSYTTITYWVGSRKMEAIEVLKEDCVITEKHFVIKIPAFKHGERAGPLKIKLSNVGMNYVVKQWNKTKAKRKIWNLTKSTAYRIIVRALGVCPHWLRHNFITTKQETLPGTPSEVDRKIQSWTGIKHRQTLDNYRMKMEKDIDEIADLEV